ncbi:MAG: type IV secretion system DNA-binding domain-containing protein [Actinomycetales bacterium]|uniref:Type IV secretion system DNA-binding domain-containing protein n=1 Tax=Candidatus Phosphoribacter hodrii TaxID=2953743 RepID=A0A9D7T4G4_9MICO|nr:type IV secretion system DNA-binding domain-containing protein [Candidatus Phosphoribacter hodrii]
MGSDQRSPLVVLEARGHAGRLTYLLGSPATDAAVVVEALQGLCPDVVLIPLREHRPVVTTAGKVALSTRHRAVTVNDLPGQARAVMAALARARADEHLALQVILGPRRIPLAVPTQSPSSMVVPWYQVAWYGNGQTIDTEKRTALRNKVSEAGFACTIRLGVTAPTPRRRELLLLGLMAALRASEAPGVQLRLNREAANRLTAATAPWRWPLRLGVHEVLALSGWPLSGPGKDDDLPGMPPSHPVVLPPLPVTGKAERVLALSTAPGPVQPLHLPIREQLKHLHVLGPTGVGKSTLLAHLALADIEAGRGLVVIEPKGALVDDILARIPKHRQDDVVVLDPADLIAPVGLNPLAGGHGRRPEVVVDALLAVFHQLWADAWGPRTQDILHAALLTLARRSDASLVMLPLLLTNPGFRRSLTHRAIAEDPVALGSFWAWYEQLSDAERAAAIAPVMNKLRAFLLRPAMRAVVGQVQPRFTLRQVFTERKILLVPLSKGTVGPEAAALLGSLVVADLWQATLERTTMPENRRHPVHVIIDEVQDYLRLPTDLADALAQARGLGVGFTLAHQYLDQLPAGMRSAILGNARSRVCFQLPPSDAAVMAKGHPELTADDFTSLGAFHVCASLHRQPERPVRLRTNRTAPEGQQLNPRTAPSKPGTLRPPTRGDRSRPGRPRHRDTGGSE